MPRPLNKVDRIENELPELPPHSILISSIGKYEDCKGYAVDEGGNIYSCKAHNFKPYYYDNEWRLVKLKNSKHGYPFFIMSNFGEDITCKVHSVVCRAFNPNTLDLNEVNHIDGNKLNNHYRNLEWCTHKENVVHAIQNNLRDTAKGMRLANSKLKDSDIQGIFNEKKTGKLNKEIALIYNIDTSIITRILNRQRWKHVEVTP